MKRDARDSSEPWTKRHPAREISTSSSDSEEPGRLLEASFFARPAPRVARDLLGKSLLRRTEAGNEAFTITETEAYEGSDDLASHASKGRTARTTVMFGPAGHFYVYLIYGLHHMLNVVTHSEGVPSAVLIRGLCQWPGPGRLTRALAINKTLNAQPALEASGLWFEDRGLVVADSQVLITPRIGVDYAGPHWAAMPWRFVLATPPPEKLQGDRSVKL